MMNETIVIFILIMETGVNLHLVINVLI